MSSEISGVSGLANRYANALFELADEQAALDAFPDEVATVISRTGRAEIATDPDAQMALASAVAVVDELDDGLSAIYTFFHPEATQRSLGSFAIQWQVEKAREDGLEYLYLGYWIRNCRKMAYKNSYRPNQGYINEKWCALSD